MAFEVDLGEIGSVDLTLSAPNTPTVTAKVLDNTVTLNWTDSTSSYAINYYEVRRGASWATATVVGQKQGSFTTVTEYAAGDYKYWVSGVDISGTYGDPGSVTVSVGNPPDYSSLLNVNSVFGGTKINTLTDTNGLLVNINLTETWQSHFTARSWTTIQSQLSAGYDYYAMPTTNTASYEEIIDYGSVITGSKITATLTSQQITGVTTITPTISVKNSVGASWTDFALSSVIYATDFRYVKIRCDFSSSDGNDVLLVQGLNIRFDTKLVNDSGKASALSSDTLGTLVTFNRSFTRVLAIGVTPNSSTACTATYTFTDTLNPTTFRVFIFDTSGSRVSKDFSWSARGV